MTKLEQKQARKISVLRKQLASVYERNRKYDHNVTLLTARLRQLILKFRLWTEV